MAFSLLVIPGASAGPRAREIKGNGSWHRFHVKSPEEVHPFLFEVRAGCRYRLTAEGRTLPRVLLEVGPGRATLYRADSRPVEGGSSPAPADAPRYPIAVVTWYPVRDAVYEARVRGFSVMTGSGRIRLETLGPDGQRVRTDRRLLAPGGTLAQVGDLHVGTPDRWDLVVDPDTAYEIRTRPGTAGPIALSVLSDGAQVVATAEPTPEMPFPTLGFVTPSGPLEGEPAPLRLEVSAALGGGGTYGVRLHVLSGPPPAESGESSVTDVAVETGMLPGKALTFRANLGDLAVLYVPKSSPYNPHGVQRLEGQAWKTLSRDETALAGQRASMRTPESAALVWFRPYRPGTYRFAERRPQDAVLLLHAAQDVPKAPLLLGTGMDPSVTAEGASSWRTVGLGVCMPGWDYLYVAVGRRRASVSMRVRDLDGRVRASRARRGVALTRVAGMGPSLRFRVKEPTVVRLELKGKAWTGYALLRRAGN